MPDKEGSEDEKTTKGVVKKKQKQMMGEEGYDTYRDNILMRGGDHRSKETKERSYTPSKQPKGQTAAQKAAKGKSALELVKADITAKYGKGAIMNVKKEELDLAKIAEAFDGYIIEKKNLKSQSLRQGENESDVDYFRRMVGTGQKMPQEDRDKINQQIKDSPIDLEAERARKEGEKAYKKISKQMSDFGKQFKKDPVKTSKSVGLVGLSRTAKFLGYKNPSGIVRSTWRKIRKDPVTAAFTATVARGTLQPPALPPVPTVQGGKVGKRTAG